MHRFRAAVVAAATCGYLFAAHAGDFEGARPVTEVHGVRLASICDGCGVVSETNVEHRPGKAGAIGAVGGTVVGGVVGHQIGSGGGNTVATVLGAVAGGVAGNAIEKKVKKVTVWTTTVSFKDGSTRTFEATTDPDLDEGDVVKIEHDRPVRHAP
jgi:outer membrane lipoprotein SlyB